MIANERCGDHGPRWYGLPANGQGARSGASDSVRRTPGASHISRGGRMDGLDTIHRLSLWAGWSPRRDGRGWNPRTSHGINARSTESTGAAPPR
jgi:hypothetical protein